ncbi:MAG TPA: DUF5671 domain-containing protein [Thermohalobaculum sp.]|nr:DUF5671 domain-containing protein [Thermohalobaculum sp.]
MASDSEEARAYVHRALAAGRPAEAIRRDLAAAGWSEPQVDRALEAWTPGLDGLPVPRPRLQLSARDALLYLTLFAALYISAWHFGALLFDLIELAYPDPADRPQDWRADSIRFSTAALIVAFPVFLALTVKLDREVARDPVRRDSAVRQWLGHLTMFLAVIVLIGATISVIYGLLRGDLTAHFLLKAATVGAIAAAIFGWFRMQLRPAPRAGRAGAWRRRG